MKNDIIPKKDGDLDGYEDNYESKYPGHATTLGIPALEITATTTIIGAHRTSYSTMLTKKAESKSAGEDNKSKKKLAIDEIRRTAKGLKTRPGYTTAIGEELRIIGIDEDIPPTSDWKPTFKVKLDGGIVVVSFLKEYSDGVKIYSKRTGDADFVFLANDTYPPYNDTRPKLEATRPETREYMMYFIYDDEQVGQPSDIVSITIP